MSPPPPMLVIVTGLSGAGNSTALAALTDAGMYCIDNLPMEMLPATIDLMESRRIVADHGLALCMDVRNASFATKFPEAKLSLAQRVRLEVIYLTADPHVIATRYSTTRRRHPLMGEGDTLMEAIEREREILGPVEEAADVVFDTTLWSPRQLARAVEGRLRGQLSPRTLHVTVTSFGFKYGALQQADMLFDVRFLDNPYFVAELKRLSGLDQEVHDFVFSSPAARTLLLKMSDLLRFLLPLYYREGKHYFRVGVGCTGGRHRSVCFAEELGRAFLNNAVPSTVLSILHRDLDR